MASKVFVGIVLALVIVSSLGLLFAAGPGGPLSTAGLPALHNTNSGFNGGIGFRVDLSGMLPDSVLGQSYVASSYTPTGNSSPITFAIEWTVAQDFSGNPLGCTEDGAWRAGQFGDFSYAIATLQYPNGTPEPINPAGSGNQYDKVFSFNNSPIQEQYCFGQYGLGGNTYQSTAGVPTGYNRSFSLGGILPTDGSVLSVIYYTKILLCSTFNLPSPPPCQDGGQNVGCPGTCGIATALLVSAESQAYVRSGYSSINVPVGKYYNGGTLPVAYSTGFSGGGSWNLMFVTPFARGPGTTVYSTSLPEASTGQINIPIPSNASQIPPSGPCTSASTCGWNTFSVQLFSPNFPVAFQSIPILISPAYAPGTPTISANDLAGHNPFQVGDTVVFTLSATYTNTSGQIATFAVQAWYNGGESTPPVSQVWFALGTPATGQTVAAKNTMNSNASLGGNATGTVQLTLTQAFSISFQIDACTANAQCVQNLVTYQVVPAGTQNPGPNPAFSFLGTYGAVLILVIVVAAAVLVAIFVPLPLWARIVIPLAAVGLSLVVYLPLVGFFAAGGAL